MSSGFTAGSDVSLDYVKDDAYLHPLGSPVSGLDKTDNGAYVKYFSRGIVVVSGADATVRVTLPPGKSRVYDLYEKKFLESNNNKLTVKLTSQVYPSGLKHSIGRIYLYDWH